jgi:hypothetical protein
MKKQLAVILTCVGVGAAAGEIINIDASMNCSPYWGYPQASVIKPVE